MNVQQKDVLILILYSFLESTYGLQLAIKGNIKALQSQGFKYDQLLEGFYIRDKTGLTNVSRPSWKNERNSLYAIWFDDENGNWLVGRGHVGFLRSSTSPDNGAPQEAKNWEYLDLNNYKWIMSSEISIKAGMQRE